MKSNYKINFINKHEMENIRGITTSSEDDFFYRYKMSKVVLVQEKTKNRLTKDKYQMKSKHHMIFLLNF